MKHYFITIILGLFISFVSAQDVMHLSGSAKITITSGASVILQGGLYVESGGSISNSGNLYLGNNSIANQSNWTDNNPSGVFSTPVNQGAINFQSASGHVISGHTVFPSFTIDAPGGIVLENDISIAGNMIFKNGKLNTGIYKLIIANDAANAVKADASNPNYINSWINGNVQRSITANTATYDFPIGNTSRANLLQFFNNNVTGPTTLTASFGAKPGSDVGLIVTENGTPYISVNNGGVWYLNANSALSGGNYALQIYFNGFTGLEDNKFGILRRPDGSTNAADWSVPAGSVSEPANGAGRKVSDGYARRMNLTSFSQWGIGMASGALPVQLINFNALRETNKSVKLVWSTATEVNNKGFEIERKFENENQFALIGFENSKAINGNSQSHLDYIYYDPNSFFGITFYRIKQIDKDNHFAYTEIKAVHGQSSSAVEVSLMPNPNKGQFKIRINGVTKSHEAIITDMNGKVVKRMTIQPQQEVNMQHLPAATYYLTIIDVFGKGKNFSEMIVVQ